MGSSTSKVAKTAAGAAKRQYPQRVPPPPSSNTASAPPPPAGQPTGPTVHPQSQASSTRDESINLDASDPDFARSLRSLGPVQPNSTLSNSSTFDPSPSQGSKSSANQSHPQIFPDPSNNPALTVLTARERLQQQAEVEFTRTGRGDGGKNFLDVSTIRQLLVLRDIKGMGEAEIEKRLGLAQGVVGRLGPRGVVGDVRIGKVGRDDAGIYD